MVSYRGVENLLRNSNLSSFVKWQFTHIWQPINQCVDMFCMYVKGVEHTINLIKVEIENTIQYNITT